MKKNNSHFSFLISHLSSQNGFTLIELLTVIGILSVIGAIAVSVVSITLQGTKKTDLLEVARQNSDIALSQMVRNIRYAAPTTCAAAVTPTTITVSSLSDYGTTVYSCTGATIASNGASLFDTNSLKVTSCSFVCSQPTAKDPPTISIQYILSPKSSQGFAESNFTLPFQTTVTMRNYSQ